MYIVFLYDPESVDSNDDLVYSGPPLTQNQIITKCQELNEHYHEFPYGYAEVDPSGTKFTYLNGELVTSYENYHLGVDTYVKTMRGSLLPFNKEKDRILKINI